MAQVDCQHRLGYLSDVDVPLPFMCFVGLSVREEMEIFGIINSKAKGLSNSLLDFHDASLAADLGVERPELFIALQLNTNSESPVVSAVGPWRNCYFRTFTPSVAPDYAKGDQKIPVTVEDPEV